MLPQTTILLFCLFISLSSFSLSSATLSNLTLLPHQHPNPEAVVQQVQRYIHTYIIYAYNRYIVLSAYNVVHAFWNTALEMASGFCTRMELYIWVLLYEIFYELGFLILVEFCH